LRSLAAILVVFLLLACDRQIDKDLVSAASSGDTKSVQRLLAEGADIETIQAKEWTPLIAAASEGKIEVVRLLLTSGADPNRPKPGGSTALEFAAMHGHVDVVMVLLSSGADPNARELKMRRSLLRKIRENGSREIEAELFKHGFNISTE
jgi:uncharacterized protein